MKWIVIGTGWITEDFIEALNCRGEEVMAVYSRTLLRAKTFAIKHNIKYFGNNMKNLSCYYDTVYIATPNSTHYDFAIKAIELNKDLMVEKPMTHSLKLTKKLYREAEAKKLRIMEAYVHITRNNVNSVLPGNLEANFMQLSSKIKNNTYKNASSFSRDYFGGVLPDIGVYPIAMAIYINGPVKSVKISNHKYLNGVEVECDIQLQHDKFISKIRISKIRNGPSKLWRNNKVVFEHIANLPKKYCHVMCPEIDLFKSTKSLKKMKSVSIETARIVEELKSLLDEQKL